MRRDGVGPVLAVGYPPTGASALPWAIAAVPLDRAVERGATTASDVLGGRIAAARDPLASRDPERRRAGGGTRAFAPRCGNGHGYGWEQE